MARTNSSQAVGKDDANEKSGDQGSRPKRTSKPVPNRWLDEITPEKKSKKNKKSRKDRQKSDSGKKKKGKSSGKTKKNKKAKKVKKSAVLVSKTRAHSDAVLDAEWHSKIAQQNADALQFSKSQPASNSRSNKEDHTPRKQFSSQPTKPRTLPNPAEDKSSDSELDIAPDILTALRRNIKYYYENGKVKTVPKDIRQNRQKQSKDRTCEGVTSLARNKSYEKRDASVASGACGGGTASGEHDSDNDEENEDRNLAILLSKIPDYIMKSFDEAKKLMYVLKLVFTKEEIANSSYTGTMSRFPSFATNYGEARIGLFDRVATEIFHIPKKRIATLICKRINYIRHSPQILVKAKERRKEKIEAAKRLQFEKDKEKSTPVDDEDDVQNAGSDVDMFDDNDNERSISREIVEQIEGVREDESSSSEESSTEESESDDGSDSDAFSDDEHDETDSNRSGDSETVDESSDDERPKNKRRKRD